MTGYTVRVLTAGTPGLWVVRASDLVRVPPGVSYWRVYPFEGEQAHPVYGVVHRRYASVWRYAATAYNFKNRNGLIAAVEEAEIVPSGDVTSDGRRHLVTV